ncbi:8953_t:CDS:1, partial [Rhizophagus irregularis]
MFDLWNVTPTEVHPEDVLDNVEDDENDNSAPNNSSNHVSTQSTKKSSDTDVELNTIACIIGEQLEPVNFSSKPKVSIKVTGSLTNDDRAHWSNDEIS